MKVKELIEELEKMPQDAEVEIVIPWGYDNASSEVYKVELRKDGIVQVS